MAIYNLGSINIDHFYRLPHLVRPGETLAAESYSQGLGGKGANQSVAIAKSENQVFHIGALNRADSHYFEQLKSYHEDNRNNYPHARLQQLRAADVVDSPAANPDGLFHREQQVAQDAERLFEFAFGLSDERPTLQALSVDGDRIRAAVSRFLSRHNLNLIQEGEPMADAVEQPEVPATPQVTREDFAAELQRYLTAFGQQGGEWFAAGKSFEDCQALQLSALREQVEALTAERDELAARIAAVDLGEDEPEQFGDDTGEQKRQARNLSEGFQGRIRITGASRN